MSKCKRAITKPSSALPLVPVPNRKLRRSKGWYLSLVLPDLLAALQDVPNCGDQPYAEVLEWLRSPANLRNFLSCCRPQTRLGVHP